MATASAGRPDASRPAAAWRQSLGAGLLLGLALGCSWLARWTPLLFTRVVLIAAAAVLSILGLGFVFAASESGGWAARWHYRLRHHFTPAAVPFFVLLVVLGLGAIASGNNLLYLVVSGLLAALIVSGLASTLNLSGMVLRFRLPEDLVAGQPALLHFNLGNEKAFWPSYSLTVSASSPARRRGAAAAEMAPLYFPQVAARSGLRGASPIVFPRRGRYAGAHFVLSTRFPFGLVIKRRRFQAPGRGRGAEPEVLVYPAAVEVKLPEGLAAAAERQAKDRRGESGDLYRIRPHQPGDSRRGVHWKATARAGELRVRELGQEQAARLRLRFALPANLEAAGVEAAVSHCAGLLASLLEAGYWLEFAGENPVDGGPRFLAAAPAGRQRRAILEYLALVEAGVGPQRVAAGDPRLREILIDGGEIAVQW